MRKRTFITGAASGIGRGIARKFLEEGGSVLLFDISAESLSETVCEFESEGFSGVHSCVGDAGCESDIKNAVSYGAEKMRGLDCIINNAGIGVWKPVEQLSLEEWRKVIDTNLTSIFLTAKYGAKFLRQSKGCMLNMASTRAIMSEPDGEAYGASKGGVVAITHALAASLAPVRVNCISPGWIDNGKFPPFTEADIMQHPVQKIGVPADIAELAYFLASEKSASFITGQNFVCDGGMSKKMIYV